MQYFHIGYIKFCKLIIHIQCAQLCCMLLSFPVALLHEWANPDRTGHGRGHSQNPRCIQTFHWLPRQERKQWQTQAHTQIWSSKEILACSASGTLSSVHDFFGLYLLYNICFAIEHILVSLMFWKHNTLTLITCRSVSYVYIRDNKVK